jgi:hypothetical protein
MTRTGGGSDRVKKVRDALDICFGVGLSVKTTAWVIRESEDLVWHEWSVRTGLPTPKDPVGSVIRRRAREVQRGWTDELRQMASLGCTMRPSSKTCEYRQAQRRENQKRYDETRKAKEQQACHSGLIDAKGKASPSPVIPQQMTLSFAFTACEAIG